MNAPQQATSPQSGGFLTAISTLSITAMVLLVGILVVTTVQDRAAAVGLNDRGGDYIVLTMQFNNGTENVVVTDAAAKWINVYGFDLSTRRVEIWTGLSLDSLQRRAQPQPPARPGRGNRRG